MDLGQNRDQPLDVGRRRLFAAQLLGVGVIPLLEVRRAGDDGIDPGVRQARQVLASFRTNHGGPGRDGCHAVVSLHLFHDVDP